MRGSESTKKEEDAKRREGGEITVLALEELID